ncbi:MAG TPA: TonB-dependent receptor [Woeseiaceae bacterium]|nr:TonB-dependent receptor [Woeseiaceae bacterium]
MNQRSRYLGLRLTTIVRAAASILAFALLLAVPVAGNAQETTSSIRGKVVDPNGNPVANATVVVEDLRSGSSRAYTSSDNGLFLASRLLPGGPYRVTVNNEKTVDVPLISVGDTYNLIVNMQADEQIEEIVAIGQAGNMAEVASGPSATFSLEDLEGSVAFNRDISDVYGIDPRLMIDNDEDGFGVNCAGKHPRFNNITLDGVSQSDRFGLNENGYATAVGQPFPYDALEQIAVELAPFDVTYGGFSACNINAVTKSGTNSWEAKVFYEYSNDSLRGNTVADSDEDFTTPSYDKTYRGFNFGGPIIKDRLFFFAAYEDSETPRFISKGYAGSGHGDEREWLSQADYDRIDAIASSVYNYDTGGQQGDGSQEDEKYLLRVDWNINDNHTASVIYNYYDGFQARDSDGDDNEFEYANHGYTKGAEFETYTGKLTSQWTDTFSTELFYSTSEMNDSQVTVGPKDFGEMQISLGTNTVFIGADDSRQANSLDNESEYLKLSGQWLLGDHIITAGYDRETLDIFNIFVQQSRGGEYRFFDDSGDNDPSCAALTAQQRFDGVNGCEASGIDRYELGRPNRVYYGSGGGTNDPNDAAAIFSNTLDAFYIQDEMFFDQLDLTVVAGLRYERYSTDDAPKFNQAFTTAQGFRNDATIDGTDLLMPRIGFTWGLSNEVTVRGGVGLYSGGNPNVWISNSYSNDGLTNAQFRRDEDDYASETGFDTMTILPGSADSVNLSSGMRPGYDVPQILIDDVLAVTPADANNSFLALIDPNYEQPREWKMALGATWDILALDMTVDIDYLYSRGDRPVYYADVAEEIVGETSAGTPIYDYIPGLRDNYMLTNSSENPVSNSFSIVARKQFDWGLDVLLGYAYTDAEDVSPMTSSTAGSNFDNTALLDVNNPSVGKSNYVVPNRFTLRLDYEKAFFGDNFTRFTLFGYFNEGQPQSYGMSSGDLEGDGFFGRHLLYVPNGPNDPNVIFASGFNSAEFFAWVADEGLSPGFTERNQRNADWSTRFDLRISQDIPLFSDLKGRVYFKVFNLGNLLNDDWGKITDSVFFTPVFMDADVDQATGRFIYNEFTNVDIERTIINSSLWEARIGIDIRFGGG